MPVQTQMQVRRGTASSWTSTNPTLAAGELGFETDTGKFKIGTGSSTWNSLLYAGGGQSSLTTYQYTATAAQTTFSGTDANGNTLSYTVGSIQVYLNGALLQNTADYAATNGTSVVLTAGALAGDSLTILSLATFSVANTYTQAQADALFIADTIVDAKGDIIAATAADTVSRLAVGANDTVLTADSTTATGLKWATVTSGLTQIATGSFSGTSVTISSIPQTYKYLNLLIRGVTNPTGGDYIGMQFNGVTSSVYRDNWLNIGSTTWSQGTARSNIRCGYTDTAGGSTYDNATYVYEFPFYATAGFLKNVSGVGSGENAIASYGQDGTNTAAITSITLLTSSGYTFNGGTYTLYGAN